MAAVAEAGVALGAGTGAVAASVELAGEAGAGSLAPKVKLALPELLGSGGAVRIVVSGGPCRSRTS